MPHEKHWLSWVALTTLCLQSLAYTQVVSSSSSSDESALRAVLDQYFMAYTRDLDACIRMWSTNSPNLGPGKEALDKLFKANQNFKVKGLSIRKMKVDAERATLRVVVDLSAVDAKTGKPADGFGRWNRDLQLVKETGSWKIWRDVAAEEALATALTAAKTNEERDALLATEKELMTAELWKALTRQGARQYLHSNFPQALMINQLSLSVAERIGDKEGIGQALSDMGVVQYTQGNYALALESLHKSLMMRKELGDKLKIAVSLTNLASIYSSQGNYSLALAPLPEAEREVKALAQLYGATSKVYIGPAAREERLKAEAGSYRILQLAAHALLNDASPMYSRVLLAQGVDGAKDDGMLEAWEMMNLDLSADLVVLSACETGRGRIAAGEGVIGITWALFVAGSPTAVVSLWKVESLTTTELMLAFHRNLLSARRAQSPTSKAEALQRAAIKMLRSKEYRHPFYWAPFSVVGYGN